MNKKERKKRMRLKELDKKKIEIKPMIGVTVGGPDPGVQFQVNPSAKFHKVMLPADPHYSVAIYGYTKRLTAIGEIIATFIRCVKRKK